MRALRQPSRSRARIVRLALAVLVGIVLGVSIDVVRAGGPTAWLARRSLAAPYVPQGERVDIGGRFLYLDCRAAGTPTVVLDAGMGGGAGSWGTVLDGLEATTRTCSYDRPGLGSSDGRGQHTLADTVADLRAALSAAGESAPFVLVGHSHGGDYGRVFAARHPDEVAGLVMLDTFDPDLESGWIHPLLGTLRPEYEAQLDALRTVVADVEHLDWPAYEQELRAAADVGIPIEVLRAPRIEPRLDTATNEAIAAAWVAAYDSLSPGMVHFQIAWGSGHNVQDDRPDLVIAATERLIDASRAASASLTP